jgi:tryptophan synthase beta chain
VMTLVPHKPRDHLMVLNMSGRGDKDLTSVADYLERRGG